MIDEDRTARAARNLDRLFWLIVSRRVPLAEAIEVSFLVADLPQFRFLSSGSKALN